MHKQYAQKIQKYHSVGLEHQCMHVFPAVEQKRCPVSKKRYTSSSAWFKNSFTRHARTCVCVCVCVCACVCDDMTVTLVNIRGHLLHSPTLCIPQHQLSSDIQHLFTQPGTPIFCFSHCHNNGTVKHSIVWPARFSLFLPSEKDNQYFINAVGMDKLQTENVYCKPTYIVKQVTK